MAFHLGNIHSVFSAGKYSAKGIIKKLDTHSIPAQIARTHLLLKKPNLTFSIRVFSIELPFNANSANKRLKKTNRIRMDSFQMTKLRKTKMRKNRISLKNLPKMSYLHI